MHLYRQVTPDIQELHQQRELTTIVLGNFTSQYRFGHFGNNLGKNISCPCTIGNNTWRTLYGTNLPTLANMVHFRQALPLSQFTTAPHHFMQVQFKQHRVKFGALRLYHAAYCHHTHISDGTQFMTHTTLYIHKFVSMAMRQFIIQQHIQVTAHHIEGLLHVGVDMGLCHFSSL